MALGHLNSGVWDTHDHYHNRHHHGGFHVAESKLMGGGMLELGGVGVGLGGVDNVRTRRSRRETLS